MTQLKQKLADLLPAWRERVVRLLKEHGDTEVSQVKISQFYGGMRGVKCLTTDISYLDPFEGIRFRGLTIPETLTVETGSGQASFRRVRNSVVSESIKQLSADIVER